DHGASDQRRDAIHNPIKADSPITPGTLPPSDACAVEAHPPIEGRGAAVRRSRLRERAHARSLQELIAVAPTTLEPVVAAALHSRHPARTREALPAPEANSIR